MTAFNRDIGDVTAPNLVCLYVTKYIKPYKMCYTKEFIDGFAFNRKHFHTNINSCIMCALWSNKDANIKSLSLRAIDIKDDKTVNYKSRLSVDRIYSIFSGKYFDKRRFEDDKEDGIVAGLNGTERGHLVKKRVTPL